MSTNTNSGLARRTALVTGASGGIGTALVAALLDRGATVVATSRRPRPDPLAQLVAEHGDRLHIVEADMNDLGSLAPLVRSVEDTHGAIDLLLPNAGVAAVRSLEDLSLDVWQDAMDVNLTAPFLLAQAVAPGMAARGYGRMLFTSSAAAYVGGYIGAHYAASKAGLHGLVHFLSSRFASSGVTANAIAPALIEGTAMIDDNFADMPRPSVPVGRLGRPEEVAALSVAILSNAYMTGQVVLLDGGIHPT
jgi:3-oxoacyl-[acyl-carrier protein] reductase